MFCDHFTLCSSYCIIIIGVVMWKAITCTHLALSAKFYTLQRQLPCVIIAKFVSSRVNTPSVNQNKDLGWFDALWYGCMRGVSLIWPVLPDRNCLIQLLPSSRPTAPGCSFSAPLHTLMKLLVSSLLKKPFLSPKSHRQHRIITPPSLAA